MQTEDKNSGKHAGALRRLEAKLSQFASRLSSSSPMKHDSNDRVGCEQMTPQNGIAPTALDVRTCSPQGKPPRSPPRSSLSACSTPKDHLSPVARSPTRLGVVGELRRRVETLEKRLQAADIAKEELRGRLEFAEAELSARASMARTMPAITPPPPPPPPARVACNGNRPTPCLPPTGPTFSCDTFDNCASRDSEVKISPSLYTVHNNFVRRGQLGRCASLQTQEELAKVQIACQQKVAEQMVLRFRSGMDTNNVAGVAAAELLQQQEYFHGDIFAQDLLTICERASTIFTQESRVLQLRSPLYVFGDIHGNLHDLQFFQHKLWTLGMALTAGTFLFLGDYVDRGQQGLEVVAFLLSQKVCCPRKIFLLRGNHELRAVNGNAAFYREMCFHTQCIERFGNARGHEVWEAINKVFDCLPMAAVVDGKVFCSHGGFPRDHDAGSDESDDDVDDERRSITSLQSHSRALQMIRSLPCPASISPAGEHETAQSVRTSTDLLWADPADAQQEHALDKFGFGQSARGGDVICFGRRASDTFLRRNGFSCLIRAHQAQAQGIGICKGARVLTVFSTSRDHGCGDDATCGCLLIDEQGCINSIVRATRADTMHAARSMLNSRRNTPVEI